jgi:hypothetical protein
MTFQWFSIDFQGFQWIINGNHATIRLEIAENHWKPLRKRRIDAWRKPKSRRWETVSKKDEP